MYNRQLSVWFTLFFGLALTLAIPSGFGRSRIRRNCGYTLLCVGFFVRITIVFAAKSPKRLFCLLFAAIINPIRKI